jgi:peroxiredoxin
MKMGIPVTNTMSMERVGDLCLPIAVLGGNYRPIEGSQVRLSSLRGQVVILFVLGIDCGACKYVAGVMSKVSQEYARDVQVVGICVQTACEERLSSFGEGAAVQFPLTYSRSRDLCTAVGIPKGTWLYYPTVIFIDRELKMRAFFVGNHDFFHDTEQNTRSLVTALLSEARTATEGEVNA